MLCAINYKIQLIVCLLEFSPQNIAWYDWQLRLKHWSEKSEVVDVDNII